MTNLDFIYEQIAAGRAPDWDKECIAAATLRSAERFFLGEDSRWKVEGVELHGDDPVPFKIDLFLSHGTEHKVIDWKYKKRPEKLDVQWRFRESRSWQPKIYAAALATRYGSEIFPLEYEVRGVGAATDDPAKVKIEVVKLEITRKMAVKAVHYFRQMTAQREALVTMGKFPWPQDPNGCRCFGPMYACDFEDYCWEGKDHLNMDITRLKTLKPFSHSSVKEYARCPQRYALIQLTGKTAGDEENTAAGILFHEVMESIYKSRSQNES